MSDINIYKQSNSYDSTKTTQLRNIFARKINSKFIELGITVRKSVDFNDCFGLRTSILTQQMYPTGRRAFAYLTSAEKVDAFMAWLQEQVDKGILQVGQFQQIGRAVQSAWTDQYILDSYKRGVIRARAELTNAGYDVPRVEDSGGIGAIMNLPMHMDRVGLLFTRTFNDLKGITAAMDSQISRILAQGIADGDGPALLARKMVSAINGTGAGELGITDALGRFIPASRRAMMLARTEIIRAHAEAQLQEFRNWGVIGVSALAEFQTAGDDRVCEKCASLQGKVFSLDEASGIIPVHPKCRCCWLPRIKELDKYN